MSAEIADEKGFQQHHTTIEKEKKRLLPLRSGKAKEKRDKQFQYDIILDFKKCILYSGEGLTTRADMTRSLINAMII